MTETALREEICRLGCRMSGKIRLTGLGTIAVLVLYMVLVGGLAKAAGARPPPYLKDAVTLRGDDALRLLVGNTLRSVGHKKSFPTYRYFMNEVLLNSAPAAARSIERS